MRRRNRQSDPELLYDHATPGSGRGGKGGSSAIHVCLLRKRTRPGAGLLWRLAAPLQWGLLSDDERSRSSLSKEQCEIDSREGKSYYVRACLDIPIKGTDRTFTWGVWCSLSEHSFAEMTRALGRPGTGQSAALFRLAVHPGSRISRHRVSQDEGTPARNRCQADRRARAHKSPLGRGSADGNRDASARDNRDRADPSG